jgi:PAS domain-containing protein
MAETENFYQDLVDHQQDFVVRFSPEGRLLFVNPAYCDSVGKSKEDLIGSVFMPVTGERYSDVIATQMVSSSVPVFLYGRAVDTDPKGLRCIVGLKSIIGDGNSVCPSLQPRYHPDPT